MSDEPTTHDAPLLDGRYRLDGLVGAGGMGQVHRAWDTRLGRRVAIKMLAPERVADPGIAARLHAEGRRLAAIAHPNLVTLYDVSAGGATAYLVMELIDGESLAQRLRREGPLPTREVAAIVTGVAAGLSALHGAGIIHRDVSPANILLGRDGRPRLADLGLAHELDRADAQAADGMIHGTLRYLAPELLDGDPASPASDVFALAAVTYAALLGRPPAVATDVVKLRAAHREPPIRPSLLRPGLDPALDEVLLRALGAAPGRPTAYAFAVAIANALRACDDPTPRPTEPGTPAARPTGVAYRTPRSRVAGRSTRRAVAAIGAGALVLALTGAALATLDRVLQRPGNPELLAGLTSTSTAQPVTVTVEAERPPKDPVPADRTTGREPSPADPATGREPAPADVAEPEDVAEPARRLEARRATGGSVAPGDRATGRRPAPALTSPIGLAVAAEPGAILRGGWTDRVAGSLAAALSRLADAASPVDPDTTPQVPVPTVAPQRLPAGDDVQLAVAVSPDRRTAAAAAASNHAAAGATRADGSASVAHRDAGGRATSGAHATTTGRGSRAGADDDRTDREDREDREDRASTAVRENREDREDKEDKGDAREDRQDREDKEDREDRSDKG